MNERHMLWMIWGAIAVSVAVISGVVLLMALVISHQGPFDQFQQHAIDVVIGALAGAGISSVLGFWLGSSFGSLLKNNLLKPAHVSGVNEGQP
jgi:membrane protein DedA with SNARE-associated domain